MITLIGLGLGLTIASFVRIYAGERFADRVPLVSVVMAAVSFGVWLVARESVVIAFPVAIGFVIAASLMRIRAAITRMNWKYSAVFGVWMLLLVSFAANALVGG